MKKNIALSIILAVILLSSINLTLSIAGHSNLAKLFLCSVETLSSENNNTNNNEGSLPDGFRKGFSMSSVLVFKGFDGSFSITRDDIGVNIGFRTERCMCCQTSNDYTACNMNNEDAICKNLKR